MTKPFELVSGCRGCGQICLAVLRNGGVARIGEIKTRTGLSDRQVTTHIGHLLDSGQLQAAGDCKWKLIENIVSERSPY